MVHLPLSVLTAMALAMNLPLGYFRSRARRLSWQWLLWVHLSIPFIATCRILSGFGFLVVPLLAAAAVIGQLVGGKVRA